MPRLSQGTMILFLFDISRSRELVIELHLSDFLMLHERKKRENQYFKSILCATAYNDRKFYYKDTLLLMSKFFYRKLKEFVNRPNRPKRYMLRNKAY